MNRSERTVRERHRFTLAADEPDSVQACLIKSFLSQNQPAHRDIGPDDRRRLDPFSEFDQGTAGTASKVEDRFVGDVCQILRIDLHSSWPFEDMLDLPSDVGRAKLRAVPYVISVEKLFESQIRGIFVQIGGDIGVTTVTAVRVFRRSEIRDSGKATIGRAAGAFEGSSVRLRPFHPG
jgi:hypothetical protein